MTLHDRVAALELVSRWWFNYDEGNMAAELPDLVAAVALGLSG